VQTHIVFYCSTDKRKKVVDHAVVLEMFGVWLALAQADKAPKRTLKAKYDAQAQRSADGIKSERRENSRVSSSVLCAWSHGTCAPNMLAADLLLTGKCYTTD
jgi:hypothetical protein